MFWKPSHRQYNLVKRSNFNLSISSRVCTSPGSSFHIPCRPTIVLGDAVYSLSHRQPYHPPLVVCYFSRPVIRVGHVPSRATPVVPQHKACLRYFHASRHHLRTEQPCSRPPLSTMMPDRDPSKPIPNVRGEDENELQYLTNIIESTISFS